MTHTPKTSTPSGSMAADFQELAAHLSGHFVLPQDASYAQVRSLWNGEFKAVQRRLYAVPRRKTWCRPFSGHGRMDAHSPCAVADMILQDEPSATRAS
jgi:hypothetical protein